MVPTPPASAVCPPELIALVVEQATRDAELVCHILTSVGLAPPPGGVRCLPADFLRELGAAVRLLHWETAGLTIHLEAGLPAAGDAIRQVFRDAVGRLKDPSAPAPDLALSRAVRRLTFDRLAWTGPADLRAEIVLDAPDEDVLVEAMARILWDRRHRPTAGLRETS